MATKQTAAPAATSIPSINIQTAEIVLVGDSPLLVHAWSEKAKRRMAGRQNKEAKQAMGAKVPFEDFCDSLYWLSPKPEHPTEEDVQAGRYGFPVTAFKGAAVDACSHVDGVTKVLARGAFHINGDMVEIEAAPPIMRTDMVRIAMGTADIRYRGEFKEWRVTLPIRFNASVLSIGQIVNLFNTAGFAIGVGEWRPAKDGSLGMFHVEQSG